MLAFPCARRPVRRRASLASVAGALILGFFGLTSSASAINLPPGFGESTIPITAPPSPPGLNPGPFNPTAVDWAPDGRMFIAEKRGRVRVIEPGGIEGGVQTTLLNIETKVNRAGDRGLLGIAVDANFQSNHYLWLVYTRELNPLGPDQSGPATSVVSRIEVNADNSLVTPTGPNTDGPEKLILGTQWQSACPTPTNTLDCIPADYLGHTINTIRSDPSDGTLWISNGDSHNNSGHPDSLSYRPYDETNFAGKLIHIDRQGNGLPNHPFCPVETNLSLTCTKIFAKGLRNPYRVTLRPGHGPVVGDVGNSTQEELDLTEPGRNYGWPCYEGSVRNPAVDQEATCQALYAQEASNPATVAEPAWSYPRNQDANDFGSAIVAGPIYGGPNYPASFNGKLFVGDYVDQTIKLLTLSGNQVTAVEDFATEVPTAVDLVTMPNGDLGYVDINFGENVGFIRRITFAGANGPPTPVASATPTQGSSPLQVQFTGSNSTDPEDDPLTYRWNFGDGSAESTEANPSHTYQNPGSYTARLTVDDGQGRNPSATVQIEVGNPPTAQISAPTDGSTYRGGDVVQLQGSATDPDDGNLTGNSLEWQVILHHSTHEHEATEGDLTGTTGSFTAFDDHDADSHYEILLTATDSDGQSDTDRVEIDPETSEVTLASSPAGAPMTYAGVVAGNAPVTRTTAVGFKSTIEAAQTFATSGRTYQFSGWSDGGARTHQITVPAADTTLTATYEEVSPQAPPPPVIDDTDPDSPADERDVEIEGMAEAGSTVRVYVDDVSDGTSPCAGVAAVQGSPAAFDAPGLLTRLPADNRTYQFTATATDAEGNVSGCSNAWTYVEDSTDPDTTIDSGPAAGSTTNDATPTFGFSSNEQNSTFECRMDGTGTVPFSPCNSGTFTPPTNLTSGPHTFEVRAKDQAANTDVTPASRSFTVDATTPSVTSTSPASGASDVATGAPVSVTFSEAMDKPSAEAAFSLAPSSNPLAIVAGSFSWSGNVMLFQPSSPLATAAAYAARVGTGARDLAQNQLAAERVWSFTTASNSQTGFPGATVIETGRLRSGSASNLSTDNNSYYRVNSTTSGTRTTAWYGRITGVPNGLSGLRVAYKGMNSRSCTQVLYIRRWTNNTWVQLDSRTVGTSEVLVERPPSGSAADYVSGTAGNGEVRVRVRCTTTSGSFFASGDLMRITFNVP